MVAKRMAKEFPVRASEVYLSLRRGVGDGIGRPALEKLTRFVCQRVSRGESYAEVHKTVMDELQSDIDAGGLL